MYSYNSWYPGACSCQFATLSYLPREPDWLTWGWLMSQWMLYNVLIPYAGQFLTWITCEWQRKSNFQSGNDVCWSGVLASIECRSGKVSGNGIYVTWQTGEPSGVCNKTTEMNVSRQGGESRDFISSFGNSATKHNCLLSVYHADNAWVNICLGITIQYHTKQAMHLHDWIYNHGPSWHQDPWPNGGRVKARHIYRVMEKPIYPYMTHVLMKAA